MKRSRNRWTALLLTAALGASCLAGCSGSATETSQAEETTTAATTQAPETEAETEAVSDGLFTPGTYEGEGTGNNGPIKVSVTFTADAIEKVEIIEHGETAGLSDPALERIPKAIVDEQSLAVDTVSVATNSSKGIMEAVTDALKEAK